jgi:hypothetical protein
LVFMQGLNLDVSANAAESSSAPSIEALIGLIAFGVNL